MDFNQSPLLYTYDDYLQMKADLKEIKKLIKSTRTEIKDAMDKGR
jgi:hypothetical protein